MILPVVFIVCCALVLGLRWARRVRRRREPDMLVTTWPDIELSQRYGGWDADAYDAGTGRDHLPRAVAHRPGEFARRSATPLGSLAQRPR